MTIALVTQSGVAVLRNGAPQARATAHGIAVLRAGGADARITQHGIAVLRPANDAAALTPAVATVALRSLPAFQVNRPGVLLVPDPAVIDLAGGAPEVKVVIKPKAQSAVQM